MEDGSDRRAPPGSDAESGAALSAAEARREGARVGCWAALLGPMQGRERGKGELAGWGAGRNGPSPRQGGGEEKPFSFYFSSFYSNLLKRIFKTNLNLKNTTQ